jgi:hypothetical protein
LSARRVLKTTLAAALATLLALGFLTTSLPAAGQGSRSAGKAAQEARQTEAELKALADQKRPRRAGSPRA